MLKALHACRGLAALCVVFYHLNIPLPNGVHTDFGAVAVFFVISGYLMRLTSDRDRRLFLTKRFLRVMPTVWVVTIAASLYQSTGLMNPPYVWPLVFKLGLPFLRANLHSFWSQYATTVAKSMLLFPMTATFTPFLGVTWTLTMEMICYVVFGLALILAGRLGPLIAVATLAFLWWVPRLFGQPVGEPVGLVNYLPYFCVGVLLSFGKKWLDAGVSRLPRLFAAVIVLALLLVFVALEANPWFLYRSLTAVFLSAALPVLASIVADAAELPVPRPLLVLGDVSFSLYLTHTTVIETFRPVWAIRPSLAPSTATGAIVITAVSILVAILTYRLIERPLVHLQHGLVKAVTAWRNAGSEALPTPAGSLGRAG